MNMEILPPWARALGVSLDKIQSWLREGAPKSRLLEWCLDNSKFKEQDYLKWAREYYSLPVVKVDFFEQPVPEDLWNKNKGNGWKESYFPLLEWDGVLFVGCLEPPPAPVSDSHVQFLLAPRSLQKIWWQALNKPAQMAVELPSISALTPPAPASLPSIPTPPPAPTPMKALPSVPAAQAPVAKVYPPAEEPAQDDGFELAFEIEDVMTEAKPAAAQPPPIKVPPPAPQMSLPSIPAPAPQAVPPPAPFLSVAIPSITIPKAAPIPEIIPEPEIEIPAAPKAEIVPEPVIETEITASEPVMQPVPEEIGGLHLSMEPAPLDKEIGLHTEPKEVVPPSPERDPTLTELTGGLEGLTFNADLTSLTEPGMRPPEPAPVEEKPSEETSGSNFEMPHGLTLSLEETSNMKAQNTAAPAVKIEEPPAPVEEAPMEMPMGLTFATTENSLETTGVTQLALGPPK
ncbi:MAG: hypothetical protein ABL958_11990, partial [Bdellovibrionia bacterium]